MLNIVVTMTPCKENEALLFYSPNYCTLNNDFIDELRGADHVFSIFFKGLVEQGIVGWKLFAEFNVSNAELYPEHWDKFIEFCEKDDRIKVCFKDDEIMFKIPTHFEV